MLKVNVNYNGSHKLPLAAQFAKYHLIIDIHISVFIGLTRPSSNHGRVSRP